MIRLEFDNSRRPQKAHKSSALMFDTRFTKRLNSSRVESKCVRRLENGLDLDNGVAGDMRTRRRRLLTEKYAKCRGPAVDSLVLTTYTANKARRIPFVYVSAIPAAKPTERH